MAAAPEFDPAGRLVTVDLWRGLACLGVLAAHTPREAPGGWREHPFFFVRELLDYGYLGVPFFVVISGFCIHRRAALRLARGQDPRPDWGPFWRRRFRRLYPTYLAAIVFSLVLATLSGVYAFQDGFAADLISHLLMVHNLSADYNGGLGNGAFWSLGMEEQLYLLYVPLLGLLAVRRGLSVVLLAAAVTVGWRVLTAVGATPVIPPLGSYGTWPFAYWLHWALGAYAVDAWAGNCRLPRWAGSGRLACALALLGGALHYNVFETLALTTFKDVWPIGAVAVRAREITFVLELLFAVAFFCVLNRGLAWERAGGAARLRPAGRVMLAVVSGIGRASYSIYLAHIPVIFLLMSLEGADPVGRTGAAWAVRFSMHYAAGLLAGFALFWTVERHFVRPAAAPPSRRPVTAPAVEEAAGTGRTRIAP